MKCHKAKKWISDYVDENLGEEKKTALEEHFQNCRDCRGILEDFQKIREGARKLTAPPVPDSGWVGIQQELISGSRKTTGTSFPKKKGFPLFSFHPARALGAAVLLAAVVGALFFGPKIWREPNKFENSGSVLALSKLDEAEHHYELAVKALAEALSASQNKMDPEVIQVFRENLDIIDASLSACKQAVLNDPTDIDSRQSLLAMYKHKTDLLSQLVLQDTGSNPGREYINKI